MFLGVYINHHVCLYVCPNVLYHDSFLTHEPIPMKLYTVAVIGPEDEHEGG